MNLNIILYNIQISQMEIFNNNDTLVLTYI